METSWRLELETMADCACESCKQAVKSWQQTAGHA